MAVKVVVAEDNFNRPNETGLGTGWVAVTAEVFSVASNTVVIPVNVTSPIARRVEVHADDQYASVDVVNSNGAQAPVLRLTDSSNYYYLFPNNGVTNVKIYKVVAGVSTEIADLGVTSLNNTWELQAEKTTLRAYKNKAQVGTDTTDAALATGYPALFGTRFDVVSLNGSFDNWVSGNLDNTLRVGQTKILAAEV